LASSSVELPDNPSRDYQREKREIPLLEVGQSGKKGNFWKEDMHEESENCREKPHMCMHGRPNGVRVRVFTMYCNGWRAMKV
jgi:hypothetical protein